jgi:hypothetical protein
LWLTRLCAIQLNQGKSQPNRSLRVCTAAVCAFQYRSGSAFPGESWSKSSAALATRDPATGTACCCNSPPRKAGGQNLRMSSGETGSFRKEGPTEQVSFKFFSPKLSIALWAGRTAQIVRSFFCPGVDQQPAGQLTILSHFFENETLAAYRQSSLPIWFLDLCNMSLDRLSIARLSFSLK